MVFFSTLLCVYVLTFYSFSAASVETKEALFDQNGSVLPQDTTRSDIDWQLLDNSLGLHNKWKSVGRLKQGVDCTATLIWPPDCGGSEKDISKKPAQILTNGHCTLLNGIDPAESERTITFNYFKNTSEAERKKVKVKKTLYETEKKFDLSLLELDITYGELARLGIHPQTISQRAFTVDTTVTNYAIPSSQIDPKDAFLRSSSCSIGKAVTIIDQHRFWEHQNVINCSVTGAASGSPLVNSNGELVGMMNAAVANEPQSLQKKCYEETCEFQGRSIPVVKPNNYGFDITFLHKCFSRCQIRPQNSECPLPESPHKLEIKPSPYIAGKIKSPMTIQGSFQKIKIKGCSIGELCDCAQNTGYTELSMKQASNLDPDVNSSQGYDPTNQERVQSENRSASFNPADFLSDSKLGVHFLCILVQDSSGRWQKNKDVEKVLIHLE